MANVSAPKLAKWPFYLADVVLVALAAWVVFKNPQSLGDWQALAVAACAVSGAWIAAIPFLWEYRGQVKFAEADSLTTAVEQINNLRTFTNQISFATAQWQIVQEHASNTIKAAGDIADRITKEARSFCEFITRANELEKTHLRLEVDKLRRGEAEWLQSALLMLDHVFALHQAGQRSGQPKLMEQLGQFQHACRDAVRRLGIVSFEPKPGEPYKEKAHQLAEPEATAPAGARISELLAPGYSFQGQIIRPAVVHVTAPEPKPESAEPELFPPQSEG